MALARRALVERALTERASRVCGLESIMSQRSQIAFCNHVYSLRISLSNETSLRPSHGHACFVSDRHLEQTFIRTLSSFNVQWLGPAVFLEVGTRDGNKTAFGPRDLYVTPDLLSPNGATLRFIAYMRNMDSNKYFPRKLSIRSPLQVSQLNSIQTQPPRLFRLLNDM